MARLLIHVEGQTEEQFVNGVLAAHLLGNGYSIVSARLIGNARQRDRRGGIRGWNSVRNDILKHLRQDAGCVVSTMVDYYGLPQSGSKAWPGRREAGTKHFAGKAVAIESAMAVDICAEMGSKFNPARFIPYVMMHEFEGMLFSDCEKFGSAIGHPELIAKLAAIRAEFATPEEINDSPITAPSKRIESLVPGYEKPLFGAWAALEIGLETISRECPHFRDWLERLVA